MKFQYVAREIITCKEYPTVLADGFICDFYGMKRGEKLKVRGLTCREREAKLFKALRVKSSSCRRLNRVYTTPDKRREYLCNELEWRKISTWIDNKYFLYFRDKYPQCQFYTSAKRLYPVAVREHNKLVGVIMPLMFDRCS